MSEYVCYLCSFGWKEAFPSSGRSLSTKNRAEAVSTLQTVPRGANLTTGWGYKGKMKAEEETMTSTATSNGIVHSYLSRLPSLSWRSFLTLTVGLVTEMRFGGNSICRAWNSQVFVPLLTSPTPAFCLFVKLPACCPFKHLLNEDRRGESYQVWLFGEVLADCRPVFEQSTVP